MARESVLDNKKLEAAFSGSGGIIACIYDFFLGFSRLSFASLASYFFLFSTGHSKGVIRCDMRIHRGSHGRRREIETVVHTKKSKHRSRWHIPRPGEVAYTKKLAIY